MSQAGVEQSSQKCPECKKGLRAVIYCRRELCGLRRGYISIAAAQSSIPQEYARYNDALGHCKPIVARMLDLSDHAYAVASTLDSPGPKTKMIEIAEAASKFAMLVQTAKYL